MSIRIEKLLTTRIFSKDVIASKAWYQNLFDCLPIEDLEDFVSFELNGYFLDISKVDEKSPFSVGGSVGYWLVGNLNHVVKKALSLGGEIYRGPLYVKETDRTIVQIKDPMGNIIGFESYEKF